MTGGGAGGGGGGMFLRDTILYASNVDLPFGLMNGPEGASTKLAGEYPDGAFIGAVGMIKWLHQQRPDLLRPDFDINTVDELYLKVSGDVMNRQKNAERPLEVATSIIMVAHDLAAHRHDNHVALVFDRRNNRDRGLLSPGGLLALEEGETLMDAIKRKAQQNLGTIINIEGNSFIPLAPYIDKETDPSRAVLVTPYVMVLEPDQLRKTKEHIQRAKTDPEYWQDFAVKTNNETDWLVLKSVRELASGNFIFRHERDNYAAVLQLKATSRGAFR